MKKEKLVRRKRKDKANKKKIKFINKESDLCKEFKIFFSKKNLVSMIFSILFLVIVGNIAYFKFANDQDLSSLKHIQKYMPEPAYGKTSMMVKVKELKENNSDTKGWIQIEDTPINYPVMQGRDNEYYLKHDYQKENNKHGSIYIKTGCNINDTNSNVIIYGHNLKDQEMFHSLLKYQDKSYYNKHKEIKIITENEELKYEIVAVFKSKVFYEEEENVFRYYDYLSFENEAEYNKYLQNIKRLELYDTGVNAKFGEQLLTMITCDYSVQNGRMIVVAKKV